MNEIELEITPVFPEIIITMPPVDSINLELLPMLTPTAVAEELPTDPLAYYILSRGNV